MARALWSKCSNAVASSVAGIAGTDAMIDGGIAEAVDTTAGIGAGIDVGTGAGIVAAGGAGGIEGAGSVDGVTGSG
jgi:hypothetical protein